MSDDPVSDSSSATVRRKPLALGRGLGALLGEARREEPLVAGASTFIRTPGSSTIPEEGLAILPVADIVPDPQQPRRHFDDAALEELAASISRRGVIQPVIVRPIASGRYQLVAGERRWRAAQKAQLHEIPALVRKLDDRDVMALALIENLQREDLNPVEEARAYQRLTDQEGMSQAEVAGLVGKSRSHVANIQRLLALPDEVLGLVELGKLSMGHARALIGHDRSVALAHQAVTKGLSVREVERLVRGSVGNGGKGRGGGDVTGGKQQNADIAAVQDHLEEFLGLTVRIVADADPRSGSVTIRYRTLDHLDLICQRLTGGGI